MREAAPGASGSAGPPQRRARRRLAPLHRPLRNRAFSTTWRPKCRSAAPVRGELEVCPSFGHAPSPGSSQQTRRWRELDSNLRYRGRRQACGRSLRAQRVETDPAKESSDQTVAWLRRLAAGVVGSPARRNSAPKRRRHSPGAAGAPTKARLPVAAEQPFALECRQ